MDIGTKYKIDSDSLNVTVYKKVTAKKTGKVSWPSIGYFSSLLNALKFLVDLEVKETWLKDFRTIIKKQEELHKLISDALQSPTGVGKE